MVWLKLEGWLKKIKRKPMVVPWLLLAFHPFPSLIANELQPTVCIVVGASGEPEYGKLFDQWAKDWTKATDGLDVTFIGQGDAPGQADPMSDDRNRIKRWIESVDKQEQPGTYWLVLMGHGTYDGKIAKFNLRGADLSATELGNWLSGSKHRWVIAVCASSSGPFIQALAHRDRIVIAATKSGSESNFSRFGGYLAESFGDLSSDLDHDQSVCVLEAFLMASRKTQRYYEEKKLLATEHAILDDNGDGKGTSADFYRGIRPTKRSQKGSVDGQSAYRVWLKESGRNEPLSFEVKTKLAAIEQQIDELRSKKSGMQEDEYYSELERLLTELARTLYPSK